MQEVERPSDRLARGWYRGFLSLLGVLCLIGGTYAMLDGHAPEAVAGGVLGVAWLIAARLLFPVG